MTPETVIAGLIGLINSLVPEPYAGKLITATRDYFAALGQQSAEAAKTAAAKENAAAVVGEILPTIVDSPLPSTQLTPSTPPPPTTSDPENVSRDAERSDPAPSIQEPASPAPAPDPNPEQPKKSNGRNQAPVF